MGNRSSNISYCVIVAIGFEIYSIYFMVIVHSHQVKKPTSFFLTYVEIQIPYTIIRDFTN